MYSTIGMFCRKWQVTGITLYWSVLSAFICIEYVVCTGTSNVQRLACLVQLVCFVGIGRSLVLLCIGLYCLH